MKISTHNTAQSFGQFGYMVEHSFTNQVVVGSSPLALTSTSDITPVSSKELLDIQATAECRFTLKRVSDMIRTYSQMHHTDKYSRHSSIIWQVWLKG